MALERALNMVEQGLVGRVIAGKHAIESHIGSGAMGDVYKARQLSLDKPVAVKVMRAAHAADPQFAARFHREARAASRIDHPNSVRTLDFGTEADGLLYIVMEYVEGRSLTHVMREDTLSPPRIVHLLSQVLRALAAAHGSGIVHRDLKPDNVVVAQGLDDDAGSDLVKVCDFGVAKLSDGGLRTTGAGGLTSTGRVIGTPEYMSPEQAIGERIDSRSDLYAVGVILFEMLTGAIPFDSETTIGLILKHVTEEPPRPSTLRSGVHPGLEAVCLKALRKRRDDRYATAKDMRLALAAALDEPAVVPAKIFSVRIVSRTIPVAAAVVADDATADAAPCNLTARPPEPTERPAPTSHDVALAPATAVAAPASTASTETQSSVVSTNERPGATQDGASVRAQPRRPTPGWQRIAAASAAVAALVGASVATTRHLTRSSAARLAAGDAIVLDASSAASASSQAGPIGITEADAKNEASAKSAPGINPAPIAPLSAASGSTPSVPAADGRVARRTPPATGPATARSAIAAAPQAAPSAAIAPPPSAAPAAIAPAVTPPPPPPPPVVAEPAADPTFDPEHGWTEIGIINATNARVDAVRGVLRQANLTGCYRMGLRAQRTRTGGTGTLNLSIDAHGRVNGAILIGGAALPDVARCVQSATMGLTLRAGAVEDSGATAEAWITFHPPG